EVRLAVRQPGNSRRRRCRLPDGECRNEKQNKQSNGCRSCKITSSKSHNSLAFAKSLLRAFTPAIAQTSSKPTNWRLLDLHILSQVMRADIGREDGARAIGRNAGCGGSGGYLVQIGRVRNEGLE